MSHPINIPVHFQGCSLKATWRAASARDGVPWVEMIDYNHDFPPPSVPPDWDDKTRREVEAELDRLAKAAFVHYDCWKLVQDFSTLKTSEALVEFLNNAGLHEPEDEVRWYEIDGATSRYPVTAFWALQDVLVRMLTTGKAISENSARAMPEKWVDIFKSGIGLKITQGRHGYVAVSQTEGAIPALICTVQSKVLQGKNFKLCKKADCSRVFEVESRGRRKNQYCSHLCAHTAWQRRARGTKVEVVDERTKYGYGVVKAQRRK